MFEHIGWLCHCFWLGLEGLGRLVMLLPWPSPGDIFGSFMIFLILWYPRQYLEKRYLKRRFGRKRAQRPPSPSDHQAAASSIGNIFNDHH